ncbi:MAG TPA: valine--tRNA ligase, partial [Candidatus Saccharimonadales bacterium]|nr:valine--tRNA ligase [Candidatus Saccharimonadales bacterium]
MKLPKAYQPSEYEADIYALWEKSAAFQPSGTGHPYSIVIPPPNANGNLHLGHGLTLAIEDVLIRYHRLKGDNVLFVPGADHAGFETQVVYERQLAKEGKSRFDFSREELYQQIWEFVAQNRDNFENQIRTLGASVDWQHYTFTLDDTIVQRAYATFKKMWDEGLIYRGERLVNFCTFHGTAFADIEVIHKEEQGTLWYITYPLVDGSGTITVATTRPETMLGDTAVAVHPNDERYKAYIGKTVKLPLTQREIPIVADEFVDTEYGTGAVKVTPAHDPNDYEIGKRHDLPSVTVITHEGTIGHDAPDPYAGLKTVDARAKIAQDLESLGLLTNTEAITHNVGHCYKCDTVIEPLLRDQWFIDMQPLAAKAISELKNGAVAFYPANKQAQLITYLENLKDWNISRQIAWGIPIPAFQNLEDADDWIYDERVDQELITVNGKTYRRDPDVFDTWFSSSSWPYATLGYPDGHDFKTYYPLSVMETGADILYPWVSRMLMFGLYITGKSPFKDVYLHGLIQDEHGQKMSKSKGNVINPIEKVQQFGADAFRMGIISVESAGNNRPYDESKLVGARNFANK